jgi:hypothetical protein
MPQDDKKRLKQRLDAAAALGKDKIKAGEYAAARKKLEVNYSGLSKTKSVPKEDTTNSAGAVQYLREQARMKKRDTPLSATPEPQQSIKNYR